MTEDAWQEFIDRPQGQDWRSNLDSLTHERIGKIDPFLLSKEERGELRNALHDLLKREDIANFLGREINYLFNQLLKIDHILRDIPEGQRPPREIMLALLDAWLAYGEFSRLPPNKDFYPSRRNGYARNYWATALFLEYLEKDIAFHEWVEMAQHDEIAFDVAQHLTINALQLNTATEEQRDFAVKDMTGYWARPSKPGTHTGKKQFQNKVILRIITIAGLHGYKETRGDSSLHRDSGCDIAEDVLRGVGDGCTYSRAKNLLKARG